jgi:hypothetical protein
MSEADSTPDTDSQVDQEVNTPGDDNVIVEVAPADVTVNIDLAPDEDPEPPTTDAPDLSSMVGAAITTALAPLVESVNSLSDRVTALETGPVNPPVVEEVPEVVVAETHETPEDEDQHNESEDSPPKSRRDHPYFRDLPILHKAG